MWNAFFLPKGTPEPIVRRLNSAMNDMLENPSLRKRLEDLGLEIVAPERRSPEYLAKFVREEVERWGRLIKAAGISADSMPPSRVARAPRSSSRRRRRRST